MGQEYATTGLVLFLFAVFCAYWAQETNRNAWLWFICGAFFGPITGYMLLLKNNYDLKMGVRKRAVE